jgi:dihydrofolate synthase/folylpolyglutamate synthase
VHVGGTNGKGSVCHLIYRALRRAGWRVGLYTSPHLVDIRERFIVNDIPIPPDAFDRWNDLLRPAVAETGASFFEANTAVAFADFAARGVDIAVVEVGLGGRLDATNVLDPLVSVVTQIARDHTEYLGDSLESIAREKAGIAKTGRPFIVGEKDPVLAEVLIRYATEMDAFVIRLLPDDEYTGPLGLPGQHQKRNAAVALAALSALPARFQVGGNDIFEAFAQTTVPGRLDRRGKWLFDVAHNPDGVKALIASMAAMDLPRPIHALVGILGDKDWAEMLPSVRSAVDRAWLTDPPSAPAERRWDIAAVAKKAGAGFSIEKDFDRALSVVQPGAGTVLVTGSFHTVGDALARLPGFAPLG